MFNSVRECSTASGQSEVFNLVRYCSAVSNRVQQCSTVYQNFAMHILVALEFFPVDLHTLVEFLAILFLPCLALAELLAKLLLFPPLLSILYRFFSISVLVRPAIVQWDTCFLFLILHTIRILPHTCSGFFCSSAYSVVHLCMSCCFLALLLLSSLSMLCDTCSACAVVV